MAFRVLIIGGRQFRDYARLRDALERALARRLPDVELVTAGGAGVPALVASYARTRGLTGVNPHRHKNRLPTDTPGASSGEHRP